MQWMIFVPFAVMYLVRFLLSSSGIMLILLGVGGYFVMQDSDMRQQVLQFLASLM